MFGVYCRYYNFHSNLHITLFLEPSCEVNNDLQPQDVDVEDVITEGSDLENDLNDDFNVLKDIYASQGTLQLKDFTPHDESNKDITQKTSFLKISLNSGRVMTVRKSTLCWLLQKSTSKLSSDRLLRVRGTSIKPKKTTFRKNPITIKKNRKKANKPNLLHEETEEESSSDEATEISLDDLSSDNPKEFSDDDDTHEKTSVYLEKYYAVYYDIGWFLGRVLSREGQIKIKFLKQDLDLFVWPKQDDIQFVNEQFVFYGPVELCGNNPFTLKRNDKVKIETKYKNLKACFK